MSEVLTNHVIPILGGIVATILFFAPLKSVAKARETSLLTVSSFPYPMMVNNCLVWIFYGLLIKDVYVFLPNVLGLALGLHYTSSVLGIQWSNSRIDVSMSEKMKLNPNSMIRVLHYGGIIIILLSSLFSFIVTPENGRQILGWTAIIFLVMFYFSPLDVLKQVIQTRNCSKIDWRLALAGTANACLWTPYGLFLNDPFIYASNAFGILNGATQLLCCLIFKRNKD